MTSGCVVPRTELRYYRSVTLAYLRRFFRLSLELGRVPSLIGNHYFRWRISSAQGHTFEDAVIFVHDMEECLKKLDSFSQKVIGHVVFEEYTHRETAALLGCTERHVRRSVPVALDRIADWMLRTGSMRPFALHCEAPKPVARAVAAPVKGGKSEKCPQLTVRKGNRVAAEMSG